MNGVFNDIFFIFQGRLFYTEEAINSINQQLDLGIKLLTKYSVLPAAPALLQTFNLTIPSGATKSE